MSRRGGGRFRTAVLGSGVLHFAAVAGFWGLSSRSEPEVLMRAYAVDLVSPPPQLLGPPVAEVAAVEPEPEPEEPEEEPEKPEPKPEPKPPPPAKQTPAAPQRPAPRPETRPAAAATRPQQQAERPPQQAATPSTGPRPDPNSPGGENLNLKFEGARCPSQGYCDNIEDQFYRYFRNPVGSRGVAEVRFVIRRDGSISTDLSLLSYTGSAAFRLAVLEAAERAGKDKAFGPLPREFQTDQLPVIMTIAPDR